MEACARRFIYGRTMGRSDKGEELNPAGVSFHVCMPLFVLSEKKRAGII